MAQFCRQEIHTRKTGHGYNSQVVYKFWFLLHKSYKPALQRTSPNHWANLFPTACTSLHFSPTFPFTGPEKHRTYTQLTLSDKCHLKSSWSLTWLPAYKAVKKQGMSSHLLVSVWVLSAYFIVDTHIYWMSESVYKWTHLPDVWLRTRLRPIVPPKEMCASLFFP